MVSKFNSHVKTVSLPDFLTAFLLLSSSDVQDHQRIYILVVAVKDLSVDATPGYIPLSSYQARASSSKEQTSEASSKSATMTEITVDSNKSSSYSPITLNIFSNIQYETVAYILRQCERDSSSLRDIHGHLSVSAGNFVDRGVEAAVVRMDVEEQNREDTLYVGTSGELREAKCKLPCSECKNTDTAERTTTLMDH